MLNFFFGSSVFGTLDGNTMPPKKSSQDAANKKIIPTTETQVFTLVHELAATLDDSTSVMATSTESLMDENSSADDYTPNTQN